MAHIETREQVSAIEVVVGGMDPYTVPGALPCGWLSRSVCMPDAQGVLQSTRVTHESDLNGGVNSIVRQVACPLVRKCVDCPNR